MGDADIDIDALLEESYKKKEIDFSLKTSGYQSSLNFYVYIK